MEGTESYSMTALMQLTPEFLLGDLEHPGPLVTLAYPEVLRMREVSQDAKKITDMDYFWELKTRRDFGAKNRYPKKGNWKKEYLRYGKELVPELIKASREGNVGRVRKLLDLGVNPNIQNDEESPALIQASLYGYSDIVRMLLAAGAEVNLRGLDGYTALMGASQEGHPEIVEILLAAGAKVDLQDDYGTPALIYASDFGRTEIVKMLQEAMRNPIR